MKRMTIIVYVEEGSPWEQMRPQQFRLFGTDGRKTVANYDARESKMQGHPVYATERRPVV